MKRILTMVVLSALLLASCVSGNIAANNSGSSADSTPAADSGKGESNLFLYAVKLTDSILSPASVQFGMSIEEVLKSTHIPEEQIDTSLGEESRRIINPIAISGLSEDILEIYSFQDDKLVAIEYAINVSESAFEKTCETLQEQATSTLPSDLLRGEDNILAAKTTTWEDAQQNTVTLSFPDTADEEGRTILLSICMTKNQTQ